MGWISVKDARAKVDNAVSLQTVYQLVHSGLVRGVKIRGRILVDDEDLAAYVKRAGLKVLRPAAPADDERVQAAVAAYKGFRKKP